MLKELEQHVKLIVVGPDVDHLASRSLAQQPRRVRHAPRHGIFSVELVQDDQERALESVVRLVGLALIVLQCERSDVCNSHEKAVALGLVLHGQAAMTGQALLVGGGYSHECLAELAEQPR